MKITITHKWYNELLPPTRRVRQVNSDCPCTIIQPTPLSPYTRHLRLDISSFTLFTVYPNFYTLSGRTGSALAWQFEGRTFAARWAQLVLWFAARIARCNTWSSGALPCVGLGVRPSIGSTVSDAIARSWLWSTTTRSSPLICFSKLLQVVDNWTHILW